MSLTNYPLDLTQQDSPINLYNTTAPGSPFGATVSATETLLLRNGIDPNIIRAFPKQFTDVAFMMSLAQRPTAGLEFIWPEAPYLVQPVAIRAGVVSPGLNTVQVVPVTAASINFVGLNDKVLYPDGQSGIVVAKVTTGGAETITVRPIVGNTLPALTTADILGNRGPTTADGVSDVLTTFRPQIAQYSNVIESVGPVAVRFDPMEMKQWENLGTTDYISATMKMAYERFLIGMHQTIWMSQYGTVALTNGQTATTTSGILEQQSNAGVPIQPCSTNTFIDVLRNTIYDTALTGESERVIFATRRWLNLIGTNQKADKVRYTPADTRWNLDIYSYEFYGHKVTLVPMDQWEDRGSYGNLMANDVIMINKQDLDLRFMNGFPLVNQKYELLNRESNPGNLYNFKLVYWTGQVAPQLKRAAYTGRFRIS